MCMIFPLLGIAADFPSLEIGKESTGLKLTAGALEQEVVLPGEARVSEQIFGLPGLSNVGRVAPGIYRGAQPRSEGYATLRKMGIRTVINLRTRHSEKDKVEAAGMRSVEVPISIIKDLKLETVKKIIAIMIDPANQPVYIHCKLGQDRTGVVVAIYRMEIDRWPLTEAEAEMQAFGFNDIWFNLKEFVRNYPVNIKK